mgnify:CR=1 FL=1|tara:strand:- start:442 stop:1416 length:975 start_codon:yes stop_codon:yes gene_type:complete
MKHLIISGCSFTNCAKSWPYWIPNDKYHMHLHASVGAGNKLISRGAMYRVSKLLNEGVNRNDIIVLVMWSGIDRKDIAWSRLHDNETFNSLISPHKNEAEALKHNWFIDSYQDKLIQNKEGNIVDEGIDYLIHSKLGFHLNFLENMGNPTIVDIMKTHIKYFHDKSESFLNTLESIVTLQNYLKSEGIKYTMSCWQNIFNDYNFEVPNEYYEGGNILSPYEIFTMGWMEDKKWSDKLKWPKEIKTKLSKDSQLLKDKYPRTSYMWDMIDWDDWWFYQDEQVEMGGLAEWVVLGERHLWGCENDPAHPTEYSHSQFTEKVVKTWI